jgi:hypothetical protein
MHKPLGQAEIDIEVCGRISVSERQRSRGLALAN